MAMFDASDFGEVKDHESLDDVTSSGFGPAGEPGTTEFATNAAEALSFVNGDVFQDYGRGEGGFAEEAALHANISALQIAAGYARDVLETLAQYPTLLAQVEEATRDRKAAQAGPRP